MSVHEEQRIDLEGSHKMCDAPHTHTLQDLWVVWNVPLLGDVGLRTARSTGFAVQLFLVSRVSLQQQAAAHTPPPAS